MSLAVNSPSPASVPSSGGVSTSAGSTLRVDRTMIVVKNVEPWPISDDLQGFPVHLSIGQESVAVAAVTLSMSNWVPVRQSSMSMKLSGELAAAQSGI